MSTDLSTDAVVVGAGAIGASCAYHLARAGLRVLVAEAFGGPAEGSTGRSFASIRAQWADPLNIEMSWRSIRAFRSFPDDHGIDVGYRPTGYLLLVPPAAWEAHLAAVGLQREHGVPVDVLDVAAAGRITPLAPDGIAGATWGPADGVVDPHLTTRAYLTLARAAGAQVLFRHPVSAIACGEADGGWLVTAGGRIVRARYVVNVASPSPAAAGPRPRRVSSGSSRRLEGRGPHRPRSPSCAGRAAPPPRPFPGQYPNRRGSLPSSWKLPWGRSRSTAGCAY